MYIFQQNIRICSRTIIRKERKEKIQHKYIILSFLYENISSSIIVDKYFDDTDKCARQISFYGFRLHVGYLPPFTDQFIAEKHVLDFGGTEVDFYVFSGVQRV